VSDPEAFFSNEKPKFLYRVDRFERGAYCAAGGLCIGLIFGLITGLVTRATRQDYIAPKSIATKGKI